MVHWSPCRCSGRGVTAVPMTVRVYCIPPAATLCPRHGTALLLFQVSANTITHGTQHNAGTVFSSVLSHCRREPLNPNAGNASSLSSSEKAQGAGPRPQCIRVTAPEVSHQVLVTLITGWLKQSYESSRWCCLDFSGGEGGGGHLAPVYW